MNLTILKTANLLKTSPYAHSIMFVGAGISRSSGLPLAAELKHSLLTTLCDPVDALQRLWLLNGVRWLRQLRSVMLESILETIVRDQPSLLRHLTLLFRGASPGMYHHLLASLLARGTIPMVLTTNFDDLIEQAYRRLRVTNRHLPELRVIISGAEHWSQNKPTLVKLHGCVTKPKSLALTLSHVGQGLEQWKKNILMRAAERPWIVLGYSDQDKDISPVLETLENRWAWFLHNGTPVKTQVPIGSQLRSMLARSKRRVIFMDVEKAITKYGTALGINPVITRQKPPSWSHTLYDILSRLATPTRCLILGDLLYEKLGDSVAAESAYTEGLKSRALTPTDRAALLLHRNRVCGDAWDLDRLETSLKGLNKLVALHGPLPARLDALVARQWATLYQKRAIRFSEQAEQLYEVEEHKWLRQSDRGEAALARMNRAVVLQKRSRYKAAETLYLEAIAQLRQLGHLPMLAKALSNFGSLLGAIGKNPEAIKAYREASDIFYMIGDPLWAARLEVNMGIVLTETGQAKTALPILRKARSTLRALGDRYWKVNAEKALRDAEHAL